jgi:hypothetical protein
VRHSRAEVTGFARVVADVLSEHPGAVEHFMSDGLRVTGKGRGIAILCASCGSLLVVTDAAREDAGRHLALTNVAQRPCCDAWTVTGG